MQCTTQRVYSERDQFKKTHIIANMEFWFLVMTGQALVMSQKDETRPAMVWSNYGRRLLSFAILLVCEITTSFA